MNKSSSFYSEQYFQKRRKQSHQKKIIYRQPRKQLFDQQTQLDIQRYYQNYPQVEGSRCDMIKYFEMLKQIYMELKEKDVRDNEGYLKVANQFMAILWGIIKHFRQELMCDVWISREEYMELGFKTQAQCEVYWKERAQKEQDKQKKWIYRTCNKCPISMQEIQFSFARTLQTVMRNCDYWDQLNGHQKINRFRGHIEQLLNVLFHQLTYKCEYATRKQPKIRPPRSRRKPRPRSSKKKRK